MRAYIFYRKELFYTVVGYVIVFAGLDIVFLEVVKSQFLEIVDTIILLLPVVLFPFWQRMYTREVYVDLFPERFDFKVTGKRGEIDKSFPLSSLECYSIQYPTASLCAVRLKAVDQRAVEFSFFRKKRAPADGDVDEMVGLIQETIAKYNGARVDGGRIMRFPSFFAGKGGLWSIVVLGVLLVAGVVLANIYKRDSAVFYPGAGLLVLMIARRARELKKYSEVRGR